MALLLQDTFDPDDSDLGSLGSDTWNRAVFERAYRNTERTGPFDQVIAKLSAGFSVLVYLPGNCMTAAAETVERDVQADWNHCGKHPGTGDPLQAWQPASDFVGKLRTWLKGRQGSQPYAIFHNLDLLGDQRGAVEMGVLFSLLEFTRRGVVLGLADRDAGELSGRMQSAFTDQIWLRTIDEEAFRRIMPYSLAACVTVAGASVPEGPFRQVVSRLRWCDPIRAVRIMDDVAKETRNGDLESVLAKIRLRTQPPDYIDPGELQEDEVITMTSGRLDGFDRETIQRLEDEVIQPYIHWQQQATTEATEWEKETSRLRQGVILHGPAGTGKTTLARWIARRIGLPIRVVSAAMIRRPLYGDAERMVRKIFREAQRAAPCVLVLDDADDLFPVRDRIGGSVASADLGIVNAALQELGGLNGPLVGVLVIMTTNRYQHLDEAMSQRLSLAIRVPYPVDRRQVGEIVDAAANFYGYQFAGDLRSQLVDEFFNPIDADNINGMNEPNATEEDRRKCQRGLYAPRMIVRDMLTLRSGHNSSVSEIELGQADLDHLRDIHKKNVPRHSSRQHAGEG